MNGKVNVNIIEHYTYMTVLLHYWQGNAKETNITWTLGYTTCMALTLTQHEDGTNLMSLDLTLKSCQSNGVALCDAINLRANS